MDANMTRMDEETLIRQLFVLGRNSEMKRFIGRVFDSRSIWEEDLRFLELVPDKMVGFVLDRRQPFVCAFYEDNNGFQYYKTEPGMFLPREPDINRRILGNPFAYTDLIDELSEEVHSWGFEPVAYRTETPPELAGISIPPQEEHEHR